MFRPVGEVLVNTVSFGSGPRVLVAIGGWTGSWELWQQPFELLSPSWRCVSYDHRGSGETVVSPGSITAEAMVADLFGVLEAMDVGTCVIAAESMGGLIAMKAALEQPERFEGLVLVSSPFPGRVGGAAALAAGSRMDYPSTVEAFSRACLPEPESEHILRWGRNLLLRSDGESAAQLLDVAAGMSFDPADVRIPTLVVHGSADVIVPPDSATSLAEAIPDAVLLRFGPQADSSAVSASTSAW